MSTKWVVTAAAEQITLDKQREGGTTFTITNPNGTADQAVFDVVAGEGADPSWFTVQEPQRSVRAGASVSYLMKVAVPAGVPAGQYQVQGRVYSVDSAPEETSVLSPRLMLEVPAAPEQAKRKLPWWWWLVAAGLVLVILVVVGVLVFRGGDDPPDGPVTMPDLVGMSEREALETLSDLGLAVEPIRYRYDENADDQVVSQSYAAGTTVDVESSIVDLVVALTFAAPEIAAPDGVPVVAYGDSAPTLEWDQADSRVRRWQVTLFQESCDYGFVIPPSCSFPEAGDGTVVEEAGSFTPELVLPDQAEMGGQSMISGWIRWSVAPLDDFGTAGPASALGYFRMELTE
jgi:hypothetical protein